MNNKCHESVDLDLKRNLSGSLCCALIIVAIMIYDRKSKVFRKFLRALTTDELVTYAARLHACKHHHPILTERQAARFYELEATRRMRIEKTQWSSWDDDKPQLYMDTYDLRQQRIAQSMIQGQPVRHPCGGSEVVTPTDPDPLGAFWQLSDEDKKQKIQKGKRILREHFEARLMAESGTQPIGNEPQGATSSASSFQWLPDPSSSTLMQAGAPTGTPFLGATAEIEKSINEGGWNWRDMPGKSYDEQWFHFVHRTPLSGYENHPFFTTNNCVKTDGTDRLPHPESLRDYQSQLPLHPKDNDERGQPDNP